MDLQYSEHHHIDMRYILCVYYEPIYIYIYIIYKSKQNATRFHRTIIYTNLGYATITEQFFSSSIYTASELNALFFLLIFFYTYIINITWGAV